MNNAKKILLVVSLLLSTIYVADAQWLKQTVNTSAGFRGLAVVNAHIVWASGTGGTVIKTLDGGKTWKVIVVPGAEKLDFRDIEAFDANTAYILSIGNGDSSRIYKTIDGGETWKLQFTNTNAKAFFDALACWDKTNCIAMSDPVDNKFVLIKTTDGENWKPMDTDKMPPAVDGEAAFAASGTCLITQGGNNAFIVTGGSAARVFRTADRGVSWLVADTPMVKGTSGSGIFSIAMWDAKNGVIVGGNYEKPEEAKNMMAFTKDGGKTWKHGGGADGYRSGVAYIDAKTIIAVGPSGSDLITNGGKAYRNIDKRSYNSIQAKGKAAKWAVGDKGRVVQHPVNSLFDLVELQKF